MSEKYTYGERIRITIEATVQAQNDDELEYQYPTALGAAEAVAVLDCSPVTVERVGPAEWPPRPGDLWRDREGDVWFVVALPDESLHFRTIGNSIAPIDWVSRVCGPLTFVHREDES